MDPTDAQSTDVAAPTIANLERTEVLLLALVLVAAHHAIPAFAMALLPQRELYEQLGKDGYYLLWDALAVPMPLILCLAAPRRSGLRLGDWNGCVLRVLGICTLPVVLTATIYPFTSRPFEGAAVGMWLISPAAQDLLFTGYLYGLFDVAYPGTLGRLPIRKAILITATFFALWHLPSFKSAPATYVVFQLIYTLIGGAWVLLARQLTGSILPGIATHMAVNYIAWMGW